jgi:hypothetical protein
VLSKSWGRYGEGGLRNGIFDAATLILQLGKKDFPEVYRRVRERYEEYKRLREICAAVPEEAEALRRKTNIDNLSRIKERCLPYFASTRETFSARQLWDKLPGEIKEETFGGSFYRFSDFLKDLADEDPTEGPFRVERIANGKDRSRFRLLGIGESTS